jgi:RND superfamily putative drug exporter
VTIPLIFAACTITGTLGAVYVFAHYVTMATYVTHLVQLIGLGIAIDYSLLIVYRFREELARNGSKDDAIVRTMTTAAACGGLLGARPSRSASRCCSSCPRRSCARWASAAS